MGTPDYPGDSDYHDVNLAQPFIGVSEKKKIIIGISLQCAGDKIPSRNYPRAVHSQVDCPPFRLTRAALGKYVKKYEFLLTVLNTLLTYYYYVRMS